MGSKLAVSVLAPTKFKVGAVAVLICLFTIAGPVLSSHAAAPAGVQAVSVQPVSNALDNACDVAGGFWGGPICWGKAMWDNGRGVASGVDAIIGLMSDPVGTFYEIMTQGIFFPMVQGAELLIISAFTAETTDASWSLAGIMTGRIGGIMSVVALVFCGIQILQGAFTRNFGRVTRGIVAAALSWPAVGAAVWLIVNLNAAGDQLTAAVLKDVNLSLVLGNLLGPVTLPAMINPLGQFTLIFLWCVLGILVFIPALMLHITFAFRRFGLLLMVGFAPVAIMSQGWEKAKGVLTKWFGLVAALLLAKPVAALLIWFCVELIEQSSAVTLDTLITGIIGLWTACLSPIMVGKLFAWMGVEAADSFSETGKAAGKQMISGAVKPIAVTASLVMAAKGLKGMAATMSQGQLGGKSNDTKTDGDNNASHGQKPAANTNHPQGAPKPANTHSQTLQATPAGEGQHGESLQGGGQPVDVRVDTPQHGEGSLGTSPHLPQSHDAGQPVTGGQASQPGKESQGAPVFGGSAQAPSGGGVFGGASGGAPGAPMPPSGAPTLGGSPSGGAGGAGGAGGEGSPGVPGAPGADGAAGVPGHPDSRGPLFGTASQPGKSPQQN